LGADVARVKQTISQTVETASLTERAKLALNTPQAPVLRVTRVRYDNADQPLALEEVVLQLSRYFGLAPDDGDISELTELAQRYGLSLGRAIERISIVPATSNVAKHLGIAAGTDVMKLDRTVENADGEPVEWRVPIPRSNRVKLPGSLRPEYARGSALRIFRRSRMSQAIASSALGLSGSRATHFSMGGPNSFTSDCAGWSLMICA
jgi:hypothetical protein